MKSKEFSDILKKENIDMKQIPELLVSKLKENHMKIATAESCTGGMLSKEITTVSGASMVFDCGVCSYANEIKNKVLGVSSKALSDFGAVSKEVAVEMARGVRKLANADIGVSTTGIAGPTGGTKEKPVGLVYVGISTENEEFFEKLLLNDKDYNREEIRGMATYIALYIAFSKIS